MTKSAPIPAEYEARIKALAPEARLARRQHRATDPKVVASRELTQIFRELREEHDCTISEIAKAAGMTYHSVSARIKGAENA